MHMKKKIGFTVMVLILAVIFIVPVAYAKPYKALTKEVGSPVEIPDGAVLPSYLSRLESANSTMFIGKTEDGCVVEKVNYLDLDFKYIDKDGYEIYAYSEYIKFEPNSAHLIGVSFITDDGEIILYMDDESAFKGPATGKLTKFKSDSGIKKIPREK